MRHNREDYWRSRDAFDEAPPRRRSHVTRTHDDDLPYQQDLWSQVDEDPPWPFPVGWERPPSVEPVGREHPQRGRRGYWGQGFEGPSAGEYWRHDDDHARPRRPDGYRTEPPRRSAEWHQPPQWATPTRPEDRKRHWPEQASGEPEWEYRFTGEHWERQPAPGGHAGRGPAGYSRPDERIHEDIGEEMTRDAALDASDIELRVERGEVTLIGTVDSVGAKRRADDIAWRARGVVDVHNQLRVRRSVERSADIEGSTTRQDAPDSGQRAR